MFFKTSTTIHDCRCLSTVLTIVSTVLEIWLADSWTWCVHSVPRSLHALSPAGLLRTRRATLTQPHAALRHACGRFTPRLAHRTRPNWRQCARRATLPSCSRARTQCSRRADLRCSRASSRWSFPTIGGASTRGRGGGRASAATICGTTASTSARSSSNGGTRKSRRASRAHSHCCCGIVQLYHQQ